MKKIIPKVLAIVGIVCVLVSCFVVSSSAFVGSSGTTYKYDGFMSLVGVVTDTYNSGMLKHYHGANAFYPARGVQGVDVVNGSYGWRYISNSNDMTNVFIIRPTSAPEGATVSWRQASYNFGSYYVNLDWCRQIGAYDIASTGLIGFYNEISPTKIDTLGEADDWVIANEISLALPCYILEPTSAVTEEPRLEFKNVVITFVTRHEGGLWNEGMVTFDTNRLRSNTGGSTTVEITVDDVNVYSGDVGGSFHNTMVLDYFNHIMTHRESFGLIDYNYKFTDTTPFNWRVYGNSTLGSSIDSGYDYYGDLRFMVPQHTTPLPQQVQMNDTNDYNLVEYDVAIDPWDWLITSVSSFLGTPLFPDLVGSPTFGSLLLIFIVVPIIIAFLKLWVGG